MDSRVKDLEEERKKLDEKMDEDRERSACAEKCVEKTLNSIKAVLLAAKVPFTGTLAIYRYDFNFRCQNIEWKKRYCLLEKFISERQDIAVRNA